MTQFSRLAACFVFAVVMWTWNTAATHAEDGFMLLSRAAESAPGQAPGPDATPAEIEGFVQLGESAWKLCVKAVAGKIEVPQEVDSQTAAAFRPLVRFLKQRAKYSLVKDDPAAMLEVLRVMVEIGRAFNVDANLANRKAGLIVDVYLTGVLQDASSELDQNSCKTAGQLIENYVKSRAPDRPDVIEEHLKLQETIYRLLVVNFQIRRFKLRSGRLPTSLEEIKGVDTTDPYDPEQRSFRFSLTPPAYKLYSVGPDERDDGGKKKYAYELLAGQSGDVVVGT